MMISLTVLDEPVKLKLVEQGRVAKPSLLTHGWLNTNTILSVFFCVGRPERFGEHSVQHELLATQFGSDVF